MSGCQQLRVTTTLWPRGRAARGRAGRRRWWSGFSSDRLSSASGRKVPLPQHTHHTTPQRRSPLPNAVLALCAHRTPRALCNHSGPPLPPATPRRSLPPRGVLLLPSPPAVISPRSVDWPEAGQLTFYPPPPLPLLLYFPTPSACMFTSPPFSVFSKPTPTMPCSCLSAACARACACVLIMSRGPPASSRRSVHGVHREFQRRATGSRRSLARPRATLCVFAPRKGSSARKPCRKHTARVRLTGWPVWIAWLRRDL